MTRERIPTSHAALEADYEIIREIGRGGTALVYLARERATGDEVAIKLIRAKYIDDDEALARFAREARYVAQVDHPNVVPVRAVLDLGASGLAIVMSHVVGRTLKQVVRAEHPIAAARVEQMMRRRECRRRPRIGMCTGVRPENIFLDSTPRRSLISLARSMTTRPTTMAASPSARPRTWRQTDRRRRARRWGHLQPQLVARDADGKRPWRRVSRVSPPEV
jgi:hypothetical protein